MTNRKPPMITIHFYAPLYFGGTVIFIVSLEGGVQSEVFLGGEGGRGITWFSGGMKRGSVIT